MYKSLQIFNQIVARDLKIYWQQKSESWATVLFFVIVCSLFPLALGPLPETALWLVPCIIWVAVLLATILAQESLIRTDQQLGVLEQLVLSPYALSMLLSGKVVANWLVTGLPLVIITPLLGLSFALPGATIKLLTVSLLLGTPTLSLLGILGTALTISLPRGGLLLAILILPLYTPVLVLGTAVGVLSLHGVNSIGHLALLLAIGILALLLVPLAVATTIRASMA